MQIYMLLCSMQLYARQENVTKWPERWVSEIHVTFPCYCETSLLYSKCALTSTKGSLIDHWRLIQPICCKQCFHVYTAPCVLLLLDEVESNAQCSYKTTATIVVYSNMIHYVMMHQTSVTLRPVPTQPSRQCFVP